MKKFTVTITQKAVDYIEKQKTAQSGPYIDKGFSIIVGEVCSLIGVYPRDYNPSEEYLDLAKDNGYMFTIPANTVDFDTAEYVEACRREREHEELVKHNKEVFGKIDWDGLRNQAALTALQSVGMYWAWRDETSARAEGPDNIADRCVQVADAVISKLQAKYLIIKPIEYEENDPHNS